MTDYLKHCMCGCIYEQANCPNCNKTPDRKLIAYLRLQGLDKDVAAADRIDALLAENERLGQQCKGLMQAGMNNGQALILAEAKLAKAVEALGRAKASIENGGGGGVVDVVWLDDPCPETLCDFIDATLAEIKGDQP